MFAINELKKRQSGIDFDEMVSVRDDLMARNSEILDASLAHAKGTISYEKGLYLLTYRLSYELTLPSSRSMKPVVYSDCYTVTEAFIEEADVVTQSELVEDELVLLIEGSHIDLKESVIDNILLNIPLRVLAPDEEETDNMPSGDSWTVMTQEQYQVQQAEKRQENSPFSALSELFEDFDEK